MRCFSCAKLSWSIICDNCQKNFFVPTIKIRKIGTLDVISFYRYTTLEPLLLTKHKPEGYRIYRYLGKMLFRPFAQEFVKYDKSTIHVVGIDEYIKNGYSHIACLTHAMKIKGIEVQYASLMAQNRVSYAGKLLQFRLQNPRNFYYSGKKEVNAILVDDIITTGLTIKEAHKTLASYDVNVLFALTLADVD